MQFTYTVKAYVRKYADQGVFTEQTFTISTVAGHRLDIGQVKELWLGTYGVGSVNDLELHRFTSIEGDLWPLPQTKTP